MQVTEPAPTCIAFAGRCRGTMPAGCGLYVTGRKVVLEKGLFELWDAHAQSLPVHLTLCGVGSGFGVPIFWGPLKAAYASSLRDLRPQR